MIEQNPSSRLTVRQALKSFYDLLIGMTIPVGFEVYGTHLVFPLVAREPQLRMSSRKQSKMIATLSLNMSLIKQCKWVQLVLEILNSKYK